MRISKNFALISLAILLCTAALTCLLRRYSTPKPPASQKLLLLRELADTQSKEWHELQDEYLAHWRPLFEAENYAEIAKLDAKYGDRVGELAERYFATLKTVREEERR